MVGNRSKNNRKKLVLLNKLTWLVICQTEP